MRISTHIGDIHDINIYKDYNQPTKKRLSIPRVEIGRCFNETNCDKHMLFLNN